MDRERSPRSYCIVGCLPEKKITPQFALRNKCPLILGKALSVLRCPLWREIVYAGKYYVYFRFSLIRPIKSHTSSSH